MKIEITETTKTTKTIDINFPYYYKHDLMSDCGDNDNIIYGKILEDCEYTIQESKGYDGFKIVFELGRDTRSDCYFKPEYKSTKEEYENAKRRALDFFNYL